MELVETALGAVKVIRPRVFRDDRGVFFESFNQRQLERLGVTRTFIQDNVAASVRTGTMRGLHFQGPPQAQAKLLRVSRGRIFDVVVDIRPGSATFGRHATFDLSADNGLLLFVPDGFAHGYCTREDNTEVQYKVDAYWAPDMERGLRWDDPALGIDWPVAPEDATVVPRDRNWPDFAQVKAALA